MSDSQNNIFATALGVPVAVLFIVFLYINMSSNIRYKVYENLSWSILIFVVILTFITYVLGLLWMHYVKMKYDEGEAAKRVCEGAGLIKDTGGAYVHKDIPVRNKLYNVVVLHSLCMALAIIMYGIYVTSIINGNYSLSAGYSNKIRLITTNFTVFSILIIISLYAFTTWLPLYNRKNITYDNSSKTALSNFVNIKKKIDAVFVAFLLAWFAGFYVFFKDTVIDRKFRLGSIFIIVIFVLTLFDIMVITKTADVMTAINQYGNDRDTITNALDPLVSSSSNEYSPFYQKYFITNMNNDKLFSEIRKDLVDYMLLKTRIKYYPKDSMYWSINTTQSEEEALQSYQSTLPVYDEAAITAHEHIRDDIIGQAIKDNYDSTRIYLYILIAIMVFIPFHQVYRVYPGATSTAMFGLVVAAIIGTISYLSYVYLVGPQTPL